MIHEWAWYVLELNPEPWAVGPVGMGRRNGKPYAYVGRNQQLFAYQQAVKEELGTQTMVEGPIELQFFFWRNRADYTTPQARTHRKHEADGTNLSKALEDALQGVFYRNDKDVVSMHWELVDQGPEVDGKIVIAIRPYWSRPITFPIGVQVMLDELKPQEEPQW